jgi:rod shape-determining protein MreC
MGQFIELFKRLYVVLLFIVLEGISLWMVTNWNGYQRSVFFQASSGISGNLHQKKTDIKDYLGLRNENKLLVSENVQLRNNTLDNDFAILFGDTVKLKGDSLRRAFSVIPAHVIQNSIYKANNIIMVSGGSENGVEVDDAVISSSGLVGLVIKTSDHFCLVMPIINERFKITPRINGKDFMGELTWTQSTGKTSIDKLSKYLDVEQGDMVYTGSASNLYPANLEIGTIAKIKAPKGGDFFEIELKLNTDFKKLKTVYIVKNKYKEEQANLLSN